MNDKGNRFMYEFEDDVEEKLALQTLLITLLNIKGGNDRGTILHFRPYVKHSQFQPPSVLSSGKRLKKKKSPRVHLQPSET